MGGVWHNCCQGLPAPVSWVTWSSGHCGLHRLRSSMWSREACAYIEAHVRISWIEEHSPVHGCIGLFLASWLGEFRRWLDASSVRFLVSMIATKCKLALVCGLEYGSAEAACPLGLPDLHRKGLEKEQGMSFSCEGHCEACRKCAEGRVWWWYPASWTDLQTPEYPTRGAFNAAFVECFVLAPGEEWTFLRQELRTWDYFADGYQLEQRLECGVGGVHAIVNEMGSSKGFEVSVHEYML